MHQCQQYNAPTATDWLCYADLRHRQYTENTLCQSLPTSCATLPTQFTWSLVHRWTKRLGIRCQLTSVIRDLVTSLSDVHWKHFCSLSTSVSSIRRFSMMMRYINQRYLSIYLAELYNWNASLVHKIKQYSSHFECCRHVGKVCYASANNKNFSYTQHTAATKTWMLCNMPINHMYYAVHSYI